jgi:hypothetical protein
MTDVRAEVREQALMSCGERRCVLPALVGIAVFHGFPTLRPLLVSEK